MNHPQRRIVLTGANRGLGLEFVNQWASQGHRVFALCRDPERAVELRSTQSSHEDKVSLHACDVLDDESVSRAADEVAEVVDAVDYVINNAGVYGDGRGVGLDQINFDDCRHVFDVNTLGPIRVTRAFRKMLMKGRQPRTVHITSLMGSITDNTSGGAWAYRMSKSALNMASRNLAIELAPATIPSIVMHPGWVQTDMGGAHAPLTVQEAVASMVQAIDVLSMKQSGQFVDRDGKTLPF